MKGNVTTGTGNRGFIIEVCLLCGATVLSILGE
jgi:hypothetical protein